MNITQLRSNYHQRICSEIIRIRRNAKAGNYPNFADSGSSISKKYAWGIFNRLNCQENFDKLEPQTAGKRFEKITLEFLEHSFSLLTHLRPGKWQYDVDAKISSFAQYEHLSYLSKIFERDPDLRSALGGDYLIKPDIVIGRWPVDDEDVDKQSILEDASKEHASYTYLRANNFAKPKRILHAVISCKWTIRSDRAQNSRTEVLNLIRNRKGHLPHIVAITADPWPAHISALAQGTGDLDCVYHFALPELYATIREIGSQDALETLKMMVNGRRLRDISDLPFDLAV